MTKVAVPGDDRYMKSYCSLVATIALISGCYASRGVAPGAAPVTHGDIPAVVEVWNLFVQGTPGISDPCWQDALYYEVIVGGSTQEVGESCGTTQKLSGCFSGRRRTLRYAMDPEEDPDYTWKVVVHELSHAALLCEGIKTREHHDHPVMRDLGPERSASPMEGVYQQLADTYGRFYEYAGEYL